PHLRRLPGEASSSHWGQRGQTAGVPPNGRVPPSRARRRLRRLHRQGKGSRMRKRIVASGLLSALLLVGAPAAAFADGHHGHHGDRGDHGHEYRKGYHRGYEHGYRRGYRDGRDHREWHGRDWDHRGSGYWYGWNWDQQCEWAWYNDPGWYSAYCG